VVRIEPGIGARFDPGQVRSCLSIVARELFPSHCRRISIYLSVFLSEFSPEFYIAEEQCRVALSLSPEQQGNYPGNLLFIFFWFFLWSFRENLLRTSEGVVCLYVP
jgi:hypothetical protein